MLTDSHSNARQNGPSERVVRSWLKGRSSKADVQDGETLGIQSASAETGTGEHRTMEGVMNRTRPKILVVDDDAAVRKFFLQVLTPIAFDVAESGDAQCALEAIESGDFDLVVCDV